MSELWEARLSVRSPCILPWLWNHQCQQCKRNGKSSRSCAPDANSYLLILLFIVFLHKSKRKLFRWPFSFSLRLALAVGKAGGFSCKCIVTWQGCKRIELWRKFFYGIGMCLVETGHERCIIMVGDDSTLILRRSCWWGIILWPIRAIQLWTVASGVPPCHNDEIKGDKVKCITS